MTAAKDQLVTMRECDDRRGCDRSARNRTMLWVLAILSTAAVAMGGVVLKQAETNSKQTAQIQANKEAIRTGTKNLDSKLESLAVDVREIRRLLIEQNRRGAGQ